MSRTGEIVLTVIGGFIYGFFAVVGALMVWFFHNEAIWDQATEELRQQQPDIAPGEMEAALQMFQGSGWLMIVISAIGLILGIVSIVFMVGDKKPKAAGIMLIVMSVLGALVTFGALIFSGVFYLIAGIMCLARKASPEATTPTE
ncbi:Protein of unknown function [Lentibacillus halodurans]|uniref:DUF4064 domain-containing protein n=1 Tax=Lentibacillus halodurans TaxID=237679 RepID=A0A1I0Y2N8_9BACI|nr:DUF4064 domain-containing protein [Lentibacillus halodurans]SFB06473.1 Protein of unknown function [Lentibacillus halodurans]